MKKVIISLLLVTLTTLLCAELPYQLVKVFPDVQTFYILFAGSLVSIALAVTLYANIFDREVTLRPSIHFHPVTPSEDPSPASYRVTPKGMIKKGDKLSPEHCAKISASLKKRAAEKKAQDARIEKTRTSKVARKKSGK
jgi:hypothetical protein